MSDGCTMWLDGWPIWLGGTGDEWLHCCVQHDQAYFDGAVTLLTHVELGACVAWSAGGILMGCIMAAGTSGWWLLTKLRRR